MYCSQTKSKVRELRVKIPTKANTDLHNGDLNNGFLLQRFCLLTSGVFNNAQSSLNYSLNYLINFSTASVLLYHCFSLYESTLRVLILCVNDIVQHLYISVHL